MTILFALFLFNIFSIVFLIFLTSINYFFRNLDEDISIFNFLKNLIFLLFRNFIITDFLAFVSNPFLEKTTKSLIFNIFL